MEMNTIWVYVLAGIACIQSVCIISLTFKWRAIRSSIVTDKETVLTYATNPSTMSLEDIDGVRNVLHEQGLASEVIKELVTKATYNLYNGDPQPEVDLIRKFAPDECINVSRQNMVLKLVEIEAKKLVPSTPKVFWKSQHQTSYMHPGLRYNESHGHVHIEKSGKYFIMSQIRTRIRVTNNRQSSDNVIHRVHHISNKRNLERIILEHVNTLCKPVSTHAEQTSTVGAIFNLDGHDQVYVSTSHPDALVTNESGNYLAIFVF